MDENTLALIEAALDDECSFGNVVRQLRLEFDYDLRLAARVGEAGLTCLAQQGNNNAASILERWNQIR